MFFSKEVEISFVHIKSLFHHIIILFKLNKNITTLSSNLRYNNIKLNLGTIIFIFLEFFFLLVLLSCIKKILFIMF